MNFKIPYIDYTNHPAYYNYSRNLRNRYRGMKIFLPEFFNILYDCLYWQYILYLGKKFRNSKIKPKSIHPKIEILKREGILGFKISDDDMKNLNDKLTTYKNKVLTHKEKVEANKRVFDDCFTPINDKETLSCIKSLLEKQHIIKIISYYLGFNVKLFKVWYNNYNETDTFNWKIDDDPLMNKNKGDTHYMHIDSSFKGVKVIIYLNKVTSENGPFKFIPGSHATNSLFDLLVRKANDKSFLDSVKPEKRLLFYSLPKIFQKKCSFGFDIKKNTSDEHKLLSQEKSFYSENGNMLVFDFNGIHRGGIINKGTREVLQLLFVRKKVNLHKK